MTSRSRFAAIYAGIFAIILALLARSNWPMLLYRLLTDGLLTLLWLASALGYGSLILRPFRLNVNGLLRNLTAIALGLGFVGLAVLALGLAGFLNSATAWPLILAGIAGIVFPLRDWLVSKPAVANPQWLLLITGPILAVATFAALVPPGILWGDEPNGYDVVEYHLQIPREWYESHRISPLTHNVFSYLSQGVESHYLLAMHLRGGPWAGAYLAQLMHVAFIALTVFAVYAAAIEFGASAAKAAFAAVACCLIPWLTLLAPVAYNEGGVLLFGTLAIALLLNANLQTAIIAGALAGLACGTKLSAVPYILLAPPVALILIHCRFKHAILYIAVGLLAFSPWLIRTYAWTGNPLFPEQARLLGKAHFTDVQVERWDRANRHPRPDQQNVVGRMTAFCEQILIAPSYGYALIPLAIVSLFFARQVRSPAIVLAIILLFMSLFWTFLTHLQGRFFTSCIPLFALLMIYFPAGWPTRAALFALILGAVISLIPRIDKLADLSSAIGIEGLTLPIDALDGFPPDQPVVLVGEARPFLFPHREVHYRTVFDVNVDDKSLNDAWAAGVSGTRLIDPNELRRFSKTYYGIPDPADPHTEPYLSTAP